MKNEALSESLKRKWASGTRKPNPKGYGKKISTTLKGLYANGDISPRPLTSEKAVEMRRNVSTESEDRIKDHLRSMAENRKGKLNPPGPSARGPNHWKALYWEIESPSGVVLKGMNLSELIRNNKQLFRPNDVVWDGPVCAARRRIGALKIGQTWRGWKLLKKEYL